ncbi:MAG TPA: nucleosidase [Mycobacteriales bacterium]|nr:nucleosidase [Mycobacteriales bacterium]
MTVLVVAALVEEVAHVHDVEVLVTGVGKAVAAATLARRLAQGPPPTLVVNVGTAGAVGPVSTGLHEIGFVTQHDFPYASIEALVGAVDRGFVLDPSGPPQPVRAAPGGVMTLATGDVFVADAERAAAIAAGGVHLVDMEAFAYAATCAAFAVPFRCVKAVSDAADAAAGETWLDSIDACATALADWVARSVAAS